MTRHPHPQNFYIAHRLYSGRAFPAGPTWGALTDGPEDRDGVIGLVIEKFKGETAPTLATVRVWHFQDDVPVRDVTEDILDEALAFLECAA